MEPIPSTPRTAHFLLVEDDQLVASALSRYLLSLSVHVTAVRTLARARAIWRETRWSGLVLDVGLPDGSGLELLKELRERLETIPVLVITGAHERAIANECHRLRASCVFKPDVAPNVAVFVERVVASELDAHQRMSVAVREIAGTVGLTDREREVFALIAFGTPRTKLAAELGISNNTLKTLLRRILTKCRETRVEGLARAALEEVVLLARAPDPS